MRRSLRKINSLNDTVHHHTNDFNTLESYLENFDRLYRKEKNCWREKTFPQYVKYNTFDKEQDANYQTTFNKEIC